MLNILMWDPSTMKQSSLSSSTTYVGCICNKNNLYELASALDRLLVLKINYKIKVAGILCQIHNLTKVC